MNRNLLTVRVCLPDGSRAHKEEPVEVKTAASPRRHRRPNIERHSITVGRDASAKTKFVPNDRQDQTSATQYHGLPPPPPAPPPPPPHTHLPPYDVALSCVYFLFFLRGFSRYVYCCFVQKACRATGGTLIGRCVATVTERRLSGDLAGFLMRRRVDLRSPVGSDDL